MWADPRVSALTTLRVPPTRQQVLEMVDGASRMWLDRGFGPWDAVERLSGRWIGRIGLFELEAWPGPEEVEVGFELLPEFWRRGFATEGAIEAIQGCFGQGLRRIISVTMRRNEGAQAAMRNSGLVHAGSCFWKGCDVVWYAIDRPPANIESAEI